MRWNNYLDVSLDLLPLSCLLTLSTEQQIPEYIRAKLVSRSLRLLLLRDGISVDGISVDGISVDGFTVSGISAASIRWGQPLRSPDTRVKAPALHCPLRQLSDSVTNRVGVFSRQRRDQVCHSVVAINNADTPPLHRLLVPLCDGTLRVRGCKSPSNRAQTSRGLLARDNEHFSFVSRPAGIIDRWLPGL